MSAPEDHRAASAQLSPMTPDEFHDFYAFSVADYAREKVRAGNWSEEEALQRSKQEFQQLLPSGLDTPNHFLYAIRDDGGEKVGALWLAVEKRRGRTTGFIYQLYIDERFRRRGFGAGAMRALEQIARALGVDTLALHVFGHNHAAIALYRGLGYDVTNINMAKKLE
jgi:ribosomal protein S18 acetylase RimI-like enzyme